MSLDNLKNKEMISENTSQESIENILPFIILDMKTALKITKSDAIYRVLLKAKALIEDAIELDEYKVNKLS